MLFTDRRSILGNVWKSSIQIGFSLAKLTQVALLTILLAMGRDIVSAADLQV